MPQIKTIFKIVCNQKFAPPPLKTLVTLFKSLVRSKIDYGLPVYASASKTHINKLDIIHRSFLRIILNSHKSTPSEILYTDTNTEPIIKRAEWLTSKYITSMSNEANSKTLRIRSYTSISTISPPGQSETNRSFLMSSTTSKITTLTCS